MKHQRLCIYAKDVSNILGKSMSQSRRILQMIRLVYNKGPKQYISVEEFSDYTGLDIEEVRKHLL